MRAGATALALVATVWVAVLLSAPMLAMADPAEPALAGSGYHSGGAVWWVVALYQAAGLICHQQVDRSFLWSGMPFPVCGRCLALYLSGMVGLIGAAAAAWVVPAWLTWPRTPLWHRGRIRAELTWLLIGMAPAALLFLAEWTVADPGTTARAVGSLPLGLVVGWLAGRELAGADR